MQDFNCKPPPGPDNHFTILDPTVWVWPVQASYGSQSYTGKIYGRHLDSFEENDANSSLPPAPSPRARICWHKKATIIINKNTLIDFFFKNNWIAYSFTFQSNLRRRLLRRQRNRWIPFKIIFLSSRISWLEPGNAAFLILNGGWCSFFLPDL